MSAIFKTKYIISFLLSFFLLLGVATASAEEFTVVIDAGHGGKDTGAIENNVKEKDVNLAVAQKLAKLLKKKDKDLKVILTRDKDEYLTLQQRADIANKSKADLFISIHTNSLDLSNPNRTLIEGASTYTLGLHKDQNNMDVARRENSVIAYESDYDTKYSGFDPNSDESYIIFELAQKANLAQSVKFADSVQKQLVNVAGRKDRGVKQAGFWVLWATSMPAVLVELDFVTNPKVADFLSSESGQTKLATAICNATVGYFEALENEHKKGKNINKNQAENKEEKSAGSSSGVTLANAQESGSKKIVNGAPAIPSNNTQTGDNTRRRRNNKSRENSENREYEEAIIAESKEYVIDNEPEKSESSRSTSLTASNSDKSKPSSTKKNTKKEDKNKKNNKDNKRIVNGKTIILSNPSENSEESSSAEIAENSAKESVQPEDTAVEKREPETKTLSNSSSQKNPSTNNSGSGSSAVRLEKKKVVYRIQILASEDYLKESNPRFCGLAPIKVTKKDNLYKYTYGETSDKEEINRMLVQVRKKIPDAFIVTQQN